MGKWHTLIMVLNLLPRSIRDKFGSYGKRKIPRVEVIVIVLVTYLSIATNIAYSVIAGVAVCAIMFSWTAAQELRVEPDDSREADGIKIYHIDGPVFFTTANKLIKIFDVDNDPEHVEVIFGYASLMDFTAISTLHKVACNYKAKEKSITYKCLNVSSQKI